MTRIAIVTGASSGIGCAFIKSLCADPEEMKDLDEIWMIARRTDRLESLKSELNDDRLIPVTADLLSTQDIQRIGALLEDKKPQVRLLINCAGMGKRGDLMDKTAEASVDTVTLNCSSLTYLTRITLPFLKGGRVINIASSAAFLPQPGFAVYAASKAYVTSFSRALSYELKREDVKVLAVCPGPVRTEFQVQATDGGSSEFTGFRKFVVADPDKLAEKSLSASRRGRKMLVYGISQKFLHFASKIIPTDLILWLETKNR